MKHAGTQKIETERLTLRKFELSDAEMMFNNWATDDEVCRYMRWQAHKVIDETITRIGDIIRNYENERIYHWGICLKCGELIGNIAVTVISEYDYKAEVSYCLSRDRWGNGYVSEAIEAVLDFMYTNTDIERIEAYHSTENPASGKVMKNAGMEYEGFARNKYRNRDGFQDCDMYGIVREMWEDKKKI